MISTGKSFQIESWLINKKFGAFRIFLLFVIFSILHIFLLLYFWFFSTFSFLHSYSRIWKEVRFSVAFLNKQKNRYEYEIVPTFYFITTVFYTQYKCMYKPDFSTTQDCWSLIEIKELLPYLQYMQSNIRQHSAVLHTTKLYPSIISVINIKTINNH